MKKALFIIFLASAFFLFLIFFSYASFRNDKLVIVICDVGQGDAIYIKTPQNSDILIDGGPDDKVLDCLNSNMPFWDKSIDSVILTHPHADHMMGLIDVIDRYKLRGFYGPSMPSNRDIYPVLEAKLAEKKLSANVLREGDEFLDKSGLRLEVLWPNSDMNERVLQNSSKIDPNDTSVVVYLEFGNFEAIFTGDVESKTLSPKGEKIGDIDILKVGHHGSKDVVSDTLLYKIKPEASIISLGKNSYGHPHATTTEMLNQHKSKIYRTDKDGDIKITSDGKEYWIKASN